MMLREVLEHLNCVVLIKKYLDDLQKLLQLEILLSWHLRELNYNPLPNLQPIEFSIIQLYLRQLHDPQGNFRP